MFCIARDVFWWNHVPSSTDPTKLLWALLVARLSNDTNEYFNRPTQNGLSKGMKACHAPSHVLCLNPSSICNTLCFWTFEAPIWRELYFNLIFYVPNHNKAVSLTTADWATTVPCCDNINAWMEHGTQSHSPVGGTGNQSIWRTIPF